MKISYILILFLIFSGCFNEKKVDQNRDEINCWYCTDESRHKLNHLITSKNEEELKKHKGDPLCCTGVKGVYRYSDYEKKREEVTHGTLSGYLIIKKQEAFVLSMLKKEKDHKIFIGFLNGIVLAAKTGLIKTVQELLKKDNISQSDLNLAVIEAAQEKHWKIVSLLLRKGASINAVKIIHLDSEVSLVQLLVENNQYKILAFYFNTIDEEILEKIAIKIENKNFDALLIKHQKGINGIIKRLLMKKQFDHLEKSSHLCAKDRLNHIFSENQIKLSLDMVKWLFKHGVVPQNRPNSILFDAVSTNQLALFQLFNQYHFNLDPENRNGRTPFIESIIQNKKRLIDWFLEQNININHQDKIKQTPLMWSIIKENDELCLKIVEKKAVINLIDLLNYTALDYAIKQKKESLVKILRKYGAKTYQELQQEEKIQDGK